MEGMLLGMELDELASLSHACLGSNDLGSLDFSLDDDFLALLKGSDLILEDEMMPTLQPASSGSSHAMELPVLLPTTANSTPQHSHDSSTPSPQRILLPSAVTRGPKASRSATRSPPLPCQPGYKASLPALSGAAATSGTAATTSSAGAAPKLWRTVTTAQQPVPVQQLLPSALEPAISKEISTNNDPQETLYATAPILPPAKAARTSNRTGRVQFRSRSSTPNTDDMGSDSGDESTDDEQEAVSNKQGSNNTSSVPRNNGSNKRKAPEIDWRSIEDPAERRRQRRLAKNRMTAARSRERKKSQWAEMEERLGNMEADNARLREMIDAMSSENSNLRAQLAAALAAQQGGCSQQSGSSAAKMKSAGSKGGKGHTEPAVLVLIATLLLLCALLPREQATVILGSVLPLTLLAKLLHITSNLKSSKGEHANNCEESSDRSTMETTPAALLLDTSSQSLISKPSIQSSDDSVDLMSSGRESPGISSCSTPAHYLSRATAGASMAFLQALAMLAAMLSMSRKRIQGVGKLLPTRKQCVHMLVC